MSIIATYNTPDESQMPATNEQLTEIENLMRSAVCDPERYRWFEVALNNNPSMSDAEELRAELVRYQLDPLTKMQGGRGTLETEKNVAFRKWMTMDNT